MDPSIFGRNARRAQYAAAQRRGLFPGNLVIMAAVLGLKPDRHFGSIPRHGLPAVCALHDTSLLIPVPWIDPGREYASEDPQQGSPAGCALVMSLTFHGLPAIQSCRSGCHIRDSSRGLLRNPCHRKPYLDTYGEKWAELSHLRISSHRSISNSS